MTAHSGRSASERGSSRVPAVDQALAILRLLASRPGPESAALIARELGLPRSTTYHLLSVMAARGFVTHLPEERRYGLGVAAFEVGSAYLRHDPLERLARPLLVRLVDEVGEICHLGVLHGRETLYLVKEQPRRHVTLVTDVGVRLPAQLTASGRAMLAHLSDAQVRALFPERSAFVDRTGRGPRSLTELRRLLSEERRRGYAVEEGFVTEGLASVAVPVFDHRGHPTAAISITFASPSATAGPITPTPAGSPASAGPARATAPSLPTPTARPHSLEGFSIDRAELAAAAARTAAALTRRITPGHR